MKSCYRVKVTAQQERFGCSGWEYEIQGNNAPPLHGWISGTKHDVEAQLKRMESKINKRHNHEVESAFRIRKLSI